MTPFSSYVWQYVGFNQSQASMSHQNGTNHSQRALAESRESAKQNSWVPESIVERRELSSHAKEILRKIRASLPPLSKSSEPSEATITGSVLPDPFFNVHRLETLPEPHKAFPWGRPDLEYYFFPCTRAWDPASPVGTWLWPPQICFAFLEGDLGWSRRLSSNYPPFIKVNMQRDDLMNWFQQETKVATTLAGPKRIPSAPSTTQNTLNSVDEAATVENEFDLACSEIIVQSGNLQDRFWTPLLSSKMDCPTKGDTEQNHGDDKNNDWEEMNSEDADEGCWEMVDPIPCGNEGWFSGFHKKRPSQKRMLTDGGA